MPIHGTATPAPLEPRRGGPSPRASGTEAIAASHGVRPRKGRGLIHVAETKVTTESAHVVMLRGVKRFPPDSRNVATPSKADTPSTGQRIGRGVASSRASAAFAAISPMVAVPPRSRRPCVGHGASPPSDEITIPASSRDTAKACPRSVPSPLPATSGVARSCTRIAVAVPPTTSAVAAVSLPNHRSIQRSDRARSVRSDRSLTRTTLAATRHACA